MALAYDSRRATSDVDALTTVLTTPGTTCRSSSSYGRPVFAIGQLEVRAGRIIERVRSGRTGPGGRLCRGPGRRGGPLWFCIERRPDAMM